MIHFFIQLFFTQTYIIVKLLSFSVLGIKRLKQIETMFVSRRLQGPRTQGLSVETLIDMLLVLYDECCNSSLRREKAIADFIQYGKWEFDFCSMIVLGLILFNNGF